MDASLTMLLSSSAISSSSSSSSSSTLMSVAVPLKYVSSTRPKIPRLLLPPLLRFFYLNVCGSPIKICLIHKTQNSSIVTPASAPFLLLGQRLALVRQRSHIIGFHGIIYGTPSGLS
mmetsp:Transcript_32900/g.69009  ORF Transcript_32900/g.69009 Transcript_32900/m.69009 type:complete len:117 (+) Transcript_32900:2959-3309(+)